MKLTKEEMECVKDLKNRVYKAVDEIIKHGVQKAMNLYNKSGEKNE